MRKLIAALALLLPAAAFAHDPLDEIYQRLEALEAAPPAHTHPLPEHTHDTTPPPDPDPDPTPTPDPDPAPGAVPAEISAMAPGTWLEYGQPWNATAPYDWLHCRGTHETPFNMVLEAWNGWARDGLKYAWIPASGGHGDSCDNGVYRYNIQTGAMEVVVPHTPLNADLTTPTPYVADADGNQTLPRSSHTYNGHILDGSWLYLMVGSRYSDGKMSRQVWRFHTTENRWERLPDRMAGGNDAHLLQTPDGPVVMGGWSLCDADLLAGLYTNCVTNHHFYIFGTARWDDMRNGFWFVDPQTDTVKFYYRSGGAWARDDNISGDIPADIASDLSSGPGVCVVPDGSILVWSNSNKLHKWDGLAWETITPNGGPPTIFKRLVQGKFDWDDDAQACIGASHANQGLWVYKPVLANSPPPDPDPEPTPDPTPDPTPGDSASFDERCNAAGVVFCDPIDTAGPWGVDANGTRRLMPNPDGTEGIPTQTWWENWRGIGWHGDNKPTLDASIGEGGGSLRMTIHSGMASNGAGMYTTNFSDDLSQRFAEGDTFFVQYRVRYSCTAMYMDCDPSSPTYKTEPRLYDSTEGGKTGFKVSIIGSGDPYAENRGKSSGSCTDLEMVLLRNQYGNFRGYHNCGWYAGWEVQASRMEGFPGDLPYPVYGYDYVTNVSRYAEGGGYVGRIEAGLFCPRGPWQDENGVWREAGDPAPTCFDAEPDEWITIQMQITVGTWQPDATWPPNSHVKVWVAREGQPQVLLQAVDMFNRGPIGNEYPDASYYGKIWLLPHLYKKSPDEVHDEAHVWYDSLIVSTEFIADPVS